MSVDKRQKQKKKRQEKQKARRQEVEKQIQREKVEEYEWQAKRAYQAHDYQRALQYALKVLKIHPAHQRMRLVAIYMVLVCHCIALSD